jgi:fatty acid amide hydrolase 2
MLSRAGRTAERSLTERSALELAAAIRTGAVSAREVVFAHAERLHAAQPRTNAVAADRFEAALAEAEEADRRVAAAADPGDLSPLLGVPCTIKESFALAGMPNCTGLVCRRDFRSETTAPPVQRLLDAGAIALGVTNTSELCMWIESENRVYGRTRNAYDPRRVAGGSSGGEGAAVGSGGAPFGLGSDIGGSIRVPAFFNGVFGHKPSAWLVPNTGQYPVAEGAASRMLCAGPLARRAEDLMPLLRTIAGPDGIDENTRTVELGDPASVNLRGMPVVLLEEASYVPVRREMREARDAAADALAGAGAEVRRVPLRSMRRALECFLVALRDGAGTSVAELIRLESGQNVSLRRAGWGAVRRSGPHTVATFALLASERLAARSPAGHTRRAVAAARALADEVEDVIGDGVLLHPPHPRVAPRHGRTVGRPWVVTTAAVFNLLGLPVTQVPLGLNPAGLPLGVQVAAGRDRDHVSIAAAMELERAFGGWVPPPRPT